MGKVPSGILNGNINQYGDYDECLQVDSAGSGGDQAKSIRGKYCLASFQVTLPDAASRREREIYDLSHSHHAFRSQLRDPGHRVPRFSSITWGICVPHGCTSEDVQHGIEKTLSLHLNRTSIHVEVLVEPQMCQMETSESLSRGTIIVGCIFGAVILLSIYATQLEDTDSIVGSFSLRKNMKTLFSMKRVDDDIEAVHGIRCLNALMLLVSHKSMAIFFLPYMNRTEMAESLGKPWSVIGRAASLYTDPFIMFSGLLTCYSFIGRYEKKRSVSVFQEYVGRLFRLLPTLGALILFCTWILPETGSGPQWPLVISHHADICKQNWWRNLLFIHNYFGFQNMCLTHTHHIGIDTQLFTVGVPLVIWFASRKERVKKAVILLLVMAAISTVARFYVSYTMELANYVYYGTSIEQMFRTADYMYILPAHRFTVYAMGLCLGLLLRHKPKRRLTKMELIIGWSVSMSLLCGAFLGPAGMGRVNYKYSAFSAACYAAFAPIAWCSSFAWTVYTSHHGYNNVLAPPDMLAWLYLGLISSLASWRGFLVWTKLSYAVYLTQFPVFFYNVGETRTPQRYSFFGALIDLKEVFWILLSSIVLTVLFDLPFQNIKKILFRQKQIVKSQ